LLAGTYDLSAAASGFAPASLKGVVVDANKIATANINVAVGNVSTSVEIVAAASVIDTTTATIQNSFDTQMARDLPVTSIPGGLGSANLALLSAGVASNGSIGAGEGPSVGGQRPRNNNFMIEGVDANDKTVTGSSIRIMPNDAVAEFNVLQNQESAQYGHSSGGQFNTILKSGTNVFHGTLYEYFENRNLNATDQIIQTQAYQSGVPAVNPRYDNNRFGGSFGGPILKNKLFFFADYEYNPTGGSSTPSALSAPTAAGYAALAGIPGLSATNLSILKQYLPAAAQADPALQPYPTVNHVTIPVGDLQATSPAYQNSQALVLTTDYNLSDKDQLRGRYVYNRSAAIDSAAELPAFFTFNTATYHVASLAEYHTFTPALNNEFRVGYNREHVPDTAGNFKYPGLDQFPTMFIAELGVEIGPDLNAPQSRTQNTYQFLDNVTWVRGRHTIQAGFDGRRYIQPTQFTEYGRGFYYYSSTQQFLTDITPDYAALRGIGAIPNYIYHGDQYSTAEFVQDTWRYRPNFTITAGLRYQYTTVPVGERNQALNSLSSVPGLITFGVPQTQKTNFAPRIGLAYSPGSRGTTSIRAGFGLAYDVIYDNQFINDQAPQLLTLVNQTGAGAANFLGSGGIPPTIPITSPAQARALTTGYIPNQELPYAINWNVSFQHVFANNYTFEARYLGTKGVHLSVQDQINIQSVVTPTNSLPTYLSAPSLATLNALPLTLTQLKAESDILPAFAANGLTNAAGITSQLPEGWSTYHGLALQLNRRFSNGLQFQGAYTWSHLIDNSTADINTTALTPRRPENSQNLSPEKASSALDRRQRLTFAMYYEVPWFKKANWLMKNVLGNWTVAPIYTYEGGEMYTVQSAVDSNLNGDSVSDRTIVNPSGAPGTGSGVTALTNSAGQTVAYLANNPTAQYIVAGKGAYANGGRNTLAGRPIDNIDLSLYKNFAVKERMHLQFGAQFFNVFNHAQFIPGTPNRVDNTSSWNSSTAVNFLTPGNPIFNNPEALFSSNPRNIQLTAKFSF
jgi:outer membrane receptor protein involved in Fe transport